MTELKLANRGFSILEVSVVILLFSMLLFSSIGAMKFYQNYYRERVTTDNLSSINTALQLYFQMHRRLPEPMHYTVFTSSVDGSDILYGLVPFEDLGLHQSAIFDGYSSSISYVVPRNLTQTNIRFYRDLNGNITLDFGADADSDDIISYLSVQNASGVVSEVAYVAVSHGKDGDGALFFEGDESVNLASEVPLVPPCTTTSSADVVDEGNALFDVSCNLRLSERFEYSFAKKSIQKDPYDDFMMYESIGSLVSRVVDQDIVECPSVTHVANVESSSGGVLASGVDYVFPRSFSGTVHALIPDPADCRSVYLQYHSSRLPTAECRNGTWAQFVSLSCSTLRFAAPDF